MTDMTGAPAIVSDPPDEAGAYVRVWLGLLALTAFTVSLAGLDLGLWNVAGVLAVASAKAGLVLWIFMHLRHDRPLVRGMVLILVVTLGIVLALTFVDTAFRRP